MILVRITCEKDTSRGAVPSGPPCPYADINIDTGRALDLQIYHQLKPHGWGFNGEQQFCPRHNPELTGLPIRLSGDYIEPLPGVRIRIDPADADGREVRAELLLDPKRYRVIRDGALWDVEHVSEEWPT